MVLLRKTETESSAHPATFTILGSKVSTCFRRAFMVFPVSTMALWEEKSAHTRNSDATWLNNRCGFVGALLLKRDLKKSRHSSKRSVNKARKHDTSKHQRARGFQGHIWILKESKLQLRIGVSCSTLTSTMSTLCNMWGRKRDNG